MRDARDFAIFGAKPSFDSLLPVGQLYFPDWERYKAAMRGIFDRKYYTNQGPLTQQLEHRLENFLGVKHAICVTNATIGLMMAAEAMGLTGKVILPAFTFIASAQSLKWCGLQPVFCDVDDNHHIAIQKIDALINADVNAIMGVNLWGGSCNPQTLVNFARDRNLPVYFDSAHAFGCRIGDTRIGNYGTLEVFSFHATKILSAAEGGCICTNDDEIAARLRNIRSSYGAGIALEVVKTSNGRMSEAQAAIALMSLDDFQKNQENNQRLYKLYCKLITKIPGIRMIEPSNISFSNYQYLVCEVDAKKYGLSRDKLLMILSAENVKARRYFFPGLHKAIEFQTASDNPACSFETTDRICATCIQLPIGALVTADSVGRICEIMNDVHCAAKYLDEVIT